ncbi:MAG: SDR family NAD(P)-dependent oxidoreductase, partial [Dehalococcoidia bacterium]|nr:SDR family NAD(P)-dependent oxidoreductase [Dehalococcoidia bacterium]
MGRVEGKSVIVTGSASGIGRATALLLATEGARVVVADVNREQGAEAAAEAGNGALFMELDVSDENNWKTVIGDTVSGFGGLDVLVNNAGISGDDG